MPGAMAYAGARGNPDVDLRDLERRALLGDLAAYRAWVKEKLRRGELPRNLSTLAISQGRTWRPQSMDPKDWAWLPGYEPWPRLVRGSDLPSNLRDEVLRSFVHRWTHENLAQRPQVRTLIGATIPPVSDVEWLDAHGFRVTREGKLSTLHRTATHMARRKNSPRRANHPGAFIFAIGNPKEDHPALRLTNAQREAMSRRIAASASTQKVQGELRRMKREHARIVSLTGKRSRAMAAMEAILSRALAIKTGSVRRPNETTSYRIKLPADRVLGTMPIGEARRLWPHLRGEIDVQVAAFKDFNRGAAPFRDVILEDDGRKEVGADYIMAKTPEMVYGGVGGSPPGSFKNAGGVVGGDPSEQTTWVHDSPNQYMIGHAVVDRDGHPVTRDFRLIGDTVAKKGWLRR